MLLLLRHGATANNLARPPRLQGRGVDIGLSDEGRRQADCAASFLADAPLAAVYASPLRRARETAQPLAAQHGLAVQTVMELVEVDVGQWEGRTWPDIQKEDAEAYARFAADPEHHGYRGGENLGDVRRRAIPAMARIAQSHIGQVVAVVAHNVVNRCFLSWVLSVPLASARAVTQDNAAINVLRYRGDHWKLITLNHIFHLSQACPAGDRP